MDLDEFEQTVIAGELIDFELCFAQAEDEDDIRAMRKICIENNVYKKAYPDWAEEFVFTDDYDMQYLLLDANECLDILICSENKEVRREVVEKDIEYAFEDHIMEYDQDIIMENLMNAIEPHAELLDTFLECHDGSWDLRALELKQKARNIVPTTIEKTMTPTQQDNSTNALMERTTKLHITITSRTMIQPSISPAQHHLLQTVSQMSLKQGISSQPKHN